MKICIDGIDQIELFRRLYNRAKPVGLGAINFKSASINREEAEKKFGNYPYEYSKNFDYVDGRYIKVTFRQEEDGKFYAISSQFDKQYGDGALSEIIENLKNDQPSKVVSESEINESLDGFASHFGNQAKQAIGKLKENFNLPLEEEPKELKDFRQQLVNSTSKGINIVSLVELKNGSLCPEPIIKTTMMCIRSLMDTIKDLSDTLLSNQGNAPTEIFASFNQHSTAMWDLCEKSKNPSYKFFGKNAQLLETFGLVINGEIPEYVRNIVLSGGISVDENLGFKISNPIKTKTEEQEKIQEMFSKQSEFSTDKKFVTSEMEISNNIKQLISNTSSAFSYGAKHKNAAIDLYKHCYNENHNIAAASYEILKKYDLLDSNSKTIKAEVKSLVLKGALEFNDNVIRWKNVVNTKEKSIMFS